MPPMIIDVDTGVDDAMALAVALAMECDVIGVTTVAGNVPVNTATRNTLDVLSYLGREDIGVHRGASHPLAADYQDAMHVHGENGLGGMVLPPSPASVQMLPGPAFILQMAERHAGELVVVTLGPLTNLAIALNVLPEIASQIDRVVVMGGAYWVAGNVTPQAEFNIYVDPDAANQVFSASWNDLTLVGLDVTQQTVFSRDRWSRISSDASGTQGLVRAVMERTFTERGMSGFYLHDPLALAVAVDPSLVQGGRRAVSVGLQGDDRGRTTCKAVAGDGPLVATGVDARRFLSAFTTKLGMPEGDVSMGFDRAE